jgi:DNA-binding transcriptional LysR family regulator
LNQESAPSAAPSFITNPVHCGVATVASGMGVSIVPAMIADAVNGQSNGGGDGGGVVYIPFADGQPHREIDLAWYLLRYRSGPSRAFAEAVPSAMAPPAAIAN